MILTPDPSEPGWTTQGGEPNPVLPRVEAHEPIPDESAHPQSFTARIRAHMLNDPGELMTQRIRQAEYHQRLEEAGAQPRN